MCVHEFVSFPAAKDFVEKCASQNNEFTAYKIFERKIYEIEEIEEKLEVKIIKK